jgi:hypothetical protein
VHGHICLDLPIDGLLCRRQLLAREGLAVREVEAQLVGVAQRAPLVGVHAQRLSECQVEHVRRGVVAGDGGAPRVVNGERELVAQAELALRDVPDVGDEGAELLDVGDGEVGA